MPAAAAPLDRVRLLDRYIRIPTVSRLVTDALAADVRDFWRPLGLELEPLRPADGAGPPALYGELPGPPGAPTLLIYGHYDVQPTGDPALWRWQGVPCSPFEPAWFLDERPVDPADVAPSRLGDLLVVARGAADNKGQHLAALLGALDAHRAGEARWTVKVLLDGEEEHGSPNLHNLAAHHRARLAADVLVGSDGPKQGNLPTLLMGVRGLLGVDLIAGNGAPASLHSGNYGNILPNPVLPLARLIAAIDARVRDYAEAHDTFRRGAADTFAEWADRAVWKPYLWPTVNTNHLITDGASPALMRTIIPRTAHARLDIRLTPDTPPAAVRALVEDAARAADEPGITFDVRTGGDLPASYTAPDRPEFDWLLGLLAEMDEGEPVALPILGGTLPSYVFTDRLGIPAFWLPAANSDNQQHDINEHYILRHYFGQIGLYRRIAGSLPAGR